MWVAGHRAWEPPEPIPNSEVKLRSVRGGSVVFGYAKPRKLVTHFFYKPEAPPTIPSEEDEAYVKPVEQDATSYMNIYNSVSHFN